MSYFKVVNNKFVLAEIGKKYTIKNNSKYGGKETEINVSQDFELLFLKSIDEDERVIYWDYKSFDILFVNVDNTVSTYTPLYHVIFQEKYDDIKISLYDIEIYNSELYNNFKNNDPNNMTVSELELYNNILDEEENTMYKYMYAKEYCKAMGMKFFIIDSKGVKDYQNDLTRYN